jgi:hypothetical protein
LVAVLHFGGQWFVVGGSWFVVRGSWFVVRGSWFVVRGSWSVVRGPWSVVGRAHEGRAWQHSRLCFSPAGLRGYVLRKQFSEVLPFVSRS